MKWNEGLRRLWVVWCWVIGGSTTLFTIIVLSTDTIDYNFFQYAAGMLVMGAIGAFLAVLPRLPWFLKDLFDWVVAGFRQSEDK